MKLKKPYTRQEYAQFAIYCNRNDCHFEDKGKYLEAVKNEKMKPIENIEELQKELDNERVSDS